MKIVNPTETPKTFQKEDTKVGELYRLFDGEQVHFRCQGGFANMGNGAYSTLGDVRSDACWIHLPDAELHTNA